LLEKVVEQSYLEKAQTRKDYKNRLSNRRPHSAQWYRLLSRNIEIKMYSSTVLSLVL